MARARNIKPSLFKNEILGMADPLCTLLFAGLWVLADRKGILEDRPLRIKAEIFPYRDQVDVNAMLNWLQASGFVQRYVSGGISCILVLQFIEHQNPHRNEALSTFPEWDGTPSEEIGTTPAFIGTTPEFIGSTRDTLAKSFENQKTDANQEVSAKPAIIGTTPAIIGSARADSLSSDSLSSDSLNLIPSLLIPFVTEQPSAAPPKKSAIAKPKPPSPTAYVWEAYSTAYSNRYGAEPVRNAKVNSQLSQFVSRIGEREAPSVASYYVGHQASYYVRSMHSVDALLRDAEKLRTEWATGRQMTATKAIQADKTATNFGAFDRLIQEAEERELRDAKH